jgi:hypothetical protein
MLKGEKSTSVQIRVKAEDLATITEFVVASGMAPENPAKAISAGISFFAQILIGNKLASGYNFRSAIDYLEKLGYFVSVKVNKNDFVDQMRNTKVDRHYTPTSEEVRRVIEQIEQKQREVPIIECSIPKDDESLLSELEKGFGNAPIVDTKLEARDET